MASVKNSYLHKVFYLEDSDYRKYFLVTGYNKKSDTYDVIECNPDGEIMTEGYQGRLPASNIKNVKFVNKSSNPVKEKKVDEAPVEKKQETKKESPKEEDPIILSWKNMKLKY